MSLNCFPEKVESSLTAKLIGTTLYLNSDGKITAVSLSSIAKGEANIDIAEINIPITEDGQTYFFNVIPEGKKLISLYVEGLKQDLNIDYVIVENNITWISELRPEITKRLRLLTQFKLSMTVATEVS